MCKTFCLLLFFYVFKTINFAELNATNPMPNPHLLNPNHVVSRAGLNNIF